MSDSNKLHDYIHGVLKSGEHGPHRTLSFDATALNDAIEKHATGIAKHIEPDVKKAAGKGPDEDVTVQNDLGNFSFETEAVTPEKKTVGKGPDEDVTVQNDLGNVSFKAEVVTPKDLDNLVEIMAKANRENAKVKAVGSLHAFSPICETSGYVIKTDHLTGTAPTSATTLKDPSQAAGLYDVLCGTTLNQLIADLDKDGRGVINLGGAKVQTIIGATATGTHGSGLAIPPLASMIIGVNLVSATFDTAGMPIQYRIEPADGITDPKKHSSPALIQDDAAFNAAVTELGALGVIYSVTISTVPLYWIKETREMVDWSKAKQLLQQGPNGDILKYRNAEVWINPYTSNVLITRRELTPTPPPGQVSEPSISIYASLVKALPALQTVAEAIDWADTLLDEELFKTLGITLAKILMAFPRLVPSAIDIALDTQNHSEPKLAKYSDIYDIGFAIDFPAISVEISYPMTTYLSAADATISSLREVRKTDIFKATTGILSLRFTLSVPTSLSMSYSATPSASPGRCYQETSSLYNFYTSVQGYGDFIVPIADQSVKSFQGRLHWGQFIPPLFTSLQYKASDPEFFASIIAFQSVAQKLDPGRMMSNAFLDQVIWLEGIPS